MKRSKISLTLILSAAVIFSMLTGCGGNNASQSSQQSSNASTSVSTSAEATGSSGKVTDKPVTLTAWSTLQPGQSKSATNAADLPFYKELEKQTGVTIQFTHPVMGQENDQFNLLIASGTFPDLIEWNWTGYPGGPDKAISDNIITPLNDLIDKDAPNLKNIMTQIPLIGKLMKSASGKYYEAPYLITDPSVLTWHGPIMRKDLFDKTGLAVPTTIDEWYTTLKAFKEKLGIDAPLTLPKSYVDKDPFNYLISCFGTYQDFYQVDGKIKYGPLEPQYKDYLSTLAKWYKEGLLDNDFAAQDSKTFDAKMINGKAAVTFANVGGGIGRYTTAGQAVNPEYKLMGIPYPTVKKGDTPKMGQQDFPVTTNLAFAITTSCKDKDIAMKWLDYGYDYNQSSKGHMLYNFGIEGVTYTMVDGFPKYTDEITKNPKGLSLQEALSEYTNTIATGPAICDVREFQQLIGLPEQGEAVKNWKTDSTNALPVVSPTSQADIDNLSTIMTDVSTYVSEMQIKFIMGEEPIDNFDKFTAQLKTMNIDQAIMIKQAAYDEFLKR